MSYFDDDREVKYRLHMGEFGTYLSDEVKLIIQQKIDDIGYYPDPSYKKLVESISSFHSVDKERVIVANGLDEIVFLLCCSYLKEPGYVLYSEKSFPGYARSTEVNGGEGIAVKLDEFCVSPKNYISSYREGTKLAFFCNPLNPCGTLSNQEELLRAIRFLNDKGVVCIVDEAYIDFAGSAKHSVLNYIDKFNHLIVLRSFSKSYGLAGARLGYAISTVKNLAPVKFAASALPFRVNVFSQCLGEMLIGDTERLTQITTRARSFVTEVEKELRTRAIAYTPSSTNFVFFNFRSIDDNFIKDQESNGIYVKDCGDFGYDGWARASFTNQQDVDEFIKCLPDKLD